MNDHFLETVKSLAKEMQERPETAGHRPMTASRESSTIALAPNLAGGRKTDNSEVTTLASYRPESAAFTFTFRPPTGRMDTDRGGQQRAMPSARPSRQNLKSSRPKSSFRRIDDDSDYIPDLDEVREEDLTMAVASAPAYELQRMASLTELNAELLQTKALSVVDGVNLRKLCKFLVPEKELVEQDENWTWDRLYNEIISSPDLSHLVRFHKKDSDMDFDSLSIK